MVMLKVFVYKSSRHLLKLKCNCYPEYSFSLCATKMRRDKLWEINKCKGPSTCVNPITNRDFRQLNVAINMNYDQTADEGRSVNISVYLHALVAQVIGSYSCSYRNAWLPKQMAITDLFSD